VRQIFSVRFFAAVGAVIALFFLLTSVFATRAAIEGSDDAGAAPSPRRIDLVDRLQEVRPALIEFDDGLTTGRTELVLDPSRILTVVPGTLGEVHCDQLATAGGCALVVDLLGEAVVWFAVVPAGAATSGVPLPAIDTLDEGVATLVNGWQVRYAPILDRRCTTPGGEEEFTSYRELRDALGDDFTSLFDTAEQRLTAVVCRQRVAYASEPDGTNTSTDTSNTDTTPTSVAVTSEG
jgi:hypothetical protein